MQHIIIHQIPLWKVGVARQISQKNEFFTFSTRGDNSHKNASFQKIRIVYMYV